MSETLAAAFVALTVGFTLGFRWPRHEHKWKSIKELEVWDVSSPNDHYPKATQFILQCEVCGKVRGVRV